MEKLLSRQYNFVYIEPLGKTVFEKPIDLVTISSPENLNLSKEVSLDDEEIDKRKIKVSLNLYYYFET